MLDFKVYSHYVHLIVTSSTDSIFPPCQDGHGRGTGLSAFSQGLLLDELMNAEAQVTGPFRPEWKAELVGTAKEYRSLIEFFQCVYAVDSSDDLSICYCYIHIDLYVYSSDNIYT